MIAMKCERCGGSYEISGNVWSKVGLAAYEVNECVSWEEFDDYRDLCPECMKDFGKWLSREEKQTGWISVEDRLPDQELLEHLKRYQEKSIEVLVMIKGGKMATALIWDGRSFSDEYHHEYEVTHWMPLPEPPGESNT